MSGRVRDGDRDLTRFEIVEYHRPKGVLRQFSLHQGIPPSCLLEQELHLVDR